MPNSAAAKPRPSTTPVKKKKQVPRSRRQLSTSTGDRPASKMLGNAVASVRTALNESMCVSRRELIGEVTNAVSNSTYLINARNKVLFPWLSGVAANFDMYYFKRCIFEYEPSCPTTTPGSIVLAIDYDVTDDNANTSFSSLCTYGGATSGQVYVPFSCPLRLENTVMQSHKYFCNGGGSGDRLADMARLVVKSESSVDPGFIFGKLYVRYDGELFDPEFASGTLESQDMITVRSTASGMHSASNTDVLGIVSELKMIIQQSGSNTTSPLARYPALTALGTTLVGSLITGFAKYWFGSIDSSLLAGWKAHTSGVVTDIDYDDLPDRGYIIRPGGPGDYLLVWRIEGLFTPAATTDTAPVMTWIFNNLEATAYGEYAVPWAISDTPLMFQNNHVMIGSKFVHMPQPDKPAGFYFVTGLGNGSWTGVIGTQNAADMRSYVHIIPAAHLSNLHL